MSGLAAGLALLPDPRPGFVRVFRGQSKVYDSMRPSGLRTSERPASDQLFRVYSHMVSLGLSAVAENDPKGMLESWALWVHAIAQHYGPSSRFLDVTRDVQVAVWFALQDCRIAALTGHLARGAASLITVALDIVAFDPPADGAAGYIFVFDVPAWDGHTLPNHGQLVDLRQAPEIFGTSPRIQAQSGCLIAGDRKINGGDLSDYLVGEPIQVTTSDLSGQLTAADLFPSPGQDRWFARLLAVPLVHRRVPENGKLALQQAVPTTMYDTGSEATKATAGLLSVLEPPLLWPYIRDELAGGATWLPEGFRPTNVTPILLELPLFAMTPPLGDQLWNAALAATAVPDASPVIDHSGAVPCSAPLGRVFLEFSPLELTTWNDLPGGGTQTFVRGAYLERHVDGLTLWQLDHEVPDGPVTVHGPYRFGSSDGGLHLVAGGTRCALDAAPVASKIVLLVLMVLKELGREPSLSPAATSIVDRELTIAPQLGGGYLATADGGPEVGVMYVVRDANGWASTFGLLLDGESRGIGVHGGKPWAELKPDELTGPSADSGP